MEYECSGNYKSNHEDPHTEFNENPHAETQWALQELADDDQRATAAMLCKPSSCLTEQEVQPISCTMSSNSHF